MFAFLLYKILKLMHNGKVRPSSCFISEMDFDYIKVCTIRCQDNLMLSFSLISTSSSLLFMKAKAILYEIRHKMQLLLRKRSNRMTVFDNQ